MDNALERSREQAEGSSALRDGSCTADRDGKAWSKPIIENVGGTSVLGAPPN